MVQQLPHSQVQLLAKAGEEAQLLAKAGEEAQLLAKAGEEAQLLAKAGEEAQLLAKAGEEPGKEANGFQNDDRRYSGGFTGELGEAGAHPNLLCPTSWYYVWTIQISLTSSYLELGHVRAT